MSFNIGDKVRIIDGDECYNTYREMFELLQTDDCQHFNDGACPNIGDFGSIENKGIHESSDSVIYLVSLAEGCFLMGDNGLVKAKYK